MDNNSRKNILAIEPVGFNGHKNFNSTILRCLSDIGNVTFAAPKGYLESCTVDSRIDIPIKFFRSQTKLGSRWNSIRVLDYVIKNSRLDDFDAIVFLAYETFSLSLRWPKEKEVFLFEHNNIDNIQIRSLNKFFYRHLPPKTVHLTFLKNAAHHIRDTYGRKVFCIPHPYYRKDVSDSGLSPDNLAEHCFMSRKIIFSPSGSTPRIIHEQLKSFVSTSNSEYYLICKGNPAQKTWDWEVCPFFENYNEIMSTCCMVFVGSQFHYRVSGVAYEALSYGKPLVYLDCSFARELHSEYPHMVFVIDDVNGIADIAIDAPRIINEYGIFLQKHSLDSIRTQIAIALGE